MCVGRKMSVNYVRVPCGCFRSQRAKVDEGGVLAGFVETTIGLDLALL